MNQKAFVTLLGFVLSLTAFVEISYANRPLKEAQAVSDEWRKTYSFDKDTYNDMQANLSVVMDTHKLMHQEGLSNALREQVLGLQGDALQKIVNKDQKVLPYLLREYANNLIARREDYSKDALEVRKIIKRNLDARHDALEAAIKSIGLAAIPSLTKLHSFAVNKRSDIIAKPTHSLINSIVKRGQAEIKKSSGVKSAADDSNRQESMDFSQ